MKKYIDLSHTIDNGLKTYKGLPAPVICDYYSREDSKKNYADGSEFQIARIDMVANTGTYIDCPFHRFEHGEDFNQIKLDRLVNIDAVCIRHDYRNSLEIPLDSVQGIDLRAKAVLFNTSWSKHWNTDAYYENHPYVSTELASYLMEQEVKLVGIDSHNIDDTRFGMRPVHTILLEAGILIVEHLCNLNALPDSGFHFSAVPPKICGVGSFPVRAMATIGHI